MVSRAVSEILVTFLVLWAPALWDAETRPPEAGCGGTTWDQQQFPWEPYTYLQGDCEKLLYLLGQRNILPC